MRDLLAERFQELTPARHDRHLDALAGKRGRDGAPDPGAGAGDERRPPLELQIHSSALAALPPSGLSPGPGADLCLFAR